MIVNFRTFSCLITMLALLASNESYAKDHNSSVLKCDSHKEKHKEKKRDYPRPKELGIANDPNAPAFPESVKNEPSIAVNPTNEKNIVISANDQTNPSQINLTGVYTSFDRGENWQQQIIDWSSTGFSSQLDNYVAFGPKPGSKGFSYKHGARAYLCADVFPNGFTSFAEAVAFAYSDDGGLNWTGLQIIGPADPTVENDKPNLATDPWQCSPNFGNVYATWTHQQFTDPDQNTFASITIMCTASTDGGLTFGEPVPISSSDISNSNRWGAFPVVASDGTLYVFWWETAEIDESNGFLQVINGNKSHDGGNTWLSEPFRVATLNHQPAFRFPFGPLPGTKLFTRPIPSAAADADNNVYVAFPNYDVSLGHGWVSLAKSTDGGCVWHEEVVANVPGRSPLYLSVSANRFNDDSDVVVSFLAFDDVPEGSPVSGGVVSGDAYSVYSSDGAKSFSHPPTRVSTKSSDPAASSGSFVGIEFMGDYTTVTDSPDGSFYYAWTDSRRGEPCAAVDFFRNNGGTPPDVQTECSSNFGRTDIFVARIKSTDKPSRPCYPLVGELIQPTFTTP